MNTRSILLTLLLLAPAAARAQAPADTAAPERRFRSGVVGAATLNMHRGEFAAYDGILECGIFERGTTPGWLAGYALDIPLSGSLALSARLGYWKADGDFTASNIYTVRVAVDDVTTVPLTSEHTLETSLDYITLDALARWNIMGGLYIAAGPTVGVPTRAAYEQQERIVSPQGITFENGESTRKIIAGNFDEQGTLPTRRGVRVAATAAIGVDIPLSRRFVLSPEVGYSQGFTSVLSSFDWKANMLRAGASLMYTFGDDGGREAIAPPAMPRPVVAFDLHNQFDDGTRLNYAEVALAEERASDVIPLLPYLFFEPNSSEIPARYGTLSHGEAGAFDERTLRDSVIGVYHRLLDIVGRRMRAYPEATITVTGCREPLDDTGSNDGLSAARADALKVYLVSTWGIAPGRIGTTARTLPATISYRSFNDGREENRRAEIRSTDPRILAPVTRQFTTATTEPDAIALVPAVQFGESIQGWHLTLAASDGTVIADQRGVGAPAEDIIWRVDPSAASAAGPTITALLETTTATGEVMRAERSIPVRRTVRSRRYNGEIVRDSLVERYNMIFFDYDTPRLSDFNEEVVALIRGRIRTSSSVSVTGLTDRVGDEGHNQDLSARRAAAGADEIRARIVPEKLRTEGAGEHLIYNNDLPEGRMYNRTVIVEIATPQE